MQLFRGSHSDVLQNDIQFSSSLGWYQFFPTPGLITIWQYSKLVGKAEIASIGS